MKILYLTNIPSPYRVSYFNELGKYCDLTVLFEKGASDERDESWKNYRFNNFNGIILNGIKVAVDSSFCYSVLKYIDRSYDFVVCCNFLLPTGILAVNYMKNKKIPYFLESDGGFAKSGNGIREKIKHNIIPGALGYFSTSAAHDEYYLAYGAERSKIYRYPFTSLNDNDILKNVIPIKEKNNIKSTLGIKEKTLILSVGQFIYRKGFDVLIKACAGLLNEDTALYIVGGKQTPEYISLCKENNITNIHFLDFMKPEALAEYYKAADFFVMPTREDIWGLVINEAMAYALPVISSERCIAGKELVHDGVNGFLFESENIEELHKKIAYMLNHPECYKKFGINSLKIISKYSFTEMAKSHIDVFEKLIGSK